MATVQQFLFETLRADSDVYAIVDSGADARIWTAYNPQTQKLPCIVYTLITDEHGHHQTGVDTIGDSTYDIDCYAATALAAMALGDTVRRCLDRWRGTYSTLWIRLVVYQGQIQSYINPIDASDAGRHVVSQTYRVVYKTVAPKQ